MKYLCVLILFFSSYLGAADCVQDEVDRSWLKQELTLAQLNEILYKQCLKIQEKSMRDQKCHLSTQSIFKYKLEGSYKIYSFENEEKCWAGLSGVRGYVLEVNGEFVEKVVTSVN
jgi:hypothetical protein